LYKGQQSLKVEWPQSIPSYSANLRVQDFDARPSALANMKAGELMEGKKKEGERRE
jgi:hypothetical protein